MATVLSGTVNRDRGVVQLSVLRISLCGQSKVGGRCGTVQILA